MEMAGRGCVPARDRGGVWSLAAVGCVVLAPVTGQEGPPGPTGVWRERRSASDAAPSHVLEFSTVRNLRDGFRSPDDRSAIRGGVARPPALRLVRRAPRT